MKFTKILAVLAICSTLALVQVATPAGFYKAAKTKIMSSLEKGPKTPECTPEKVEEFRRIFLEKLQRNSGQFVDLSTKIVSDGIELSDEQKEFCATELADVAARTRAVQQRVEGQMPA